MSNYKVQAAVCNNMGHLRRNNEDNFFLNGKYMLLRQMDAGGTFTCEGTGPQVYAVCDGMGGGDAGEEASFMVVEALAEATKNGGIPSAKALCELLQRTSNRINRKHNSVTGSTVAMLAIDAGHVLVLNVGDSRIYRLRNGRFKQVSFDHVGYQAHSITQYLGMPEDDPLEPYMRMDDVGEWTVGADTDTVYLLCSDGLTDMVANLDIRTILMREKDPKAAAQQLVEAALRHGGKDNVTAMVVRVPQDMIIAQDNKAFRAWMTVLQVLAGSGMLFALIMLLITLFS